MVWVLYTNEVSKDINFIVSLTVLPGKSGSINFEKLIVALGIVAVSFCEITSRTNSE